MPQFATRGLGRGQALDNPFVEERSRIAKYGSVRMLASPIVDALSAAPREHAPALGADTNAVLREWAYSADEIAALRRDRVI